MAGRDNHSRNADNFVPAFRWPRRSPFHPRRVSEKVFWAYGFPLATLDFAIFCDLSPFFGQNLKNAFLGGGNRRLHSERSQRCCAGRIRGGNRVSVPPKLARNGRETAEISPSQNRRFEILAKFGSKSKKSPSPNHKGRKPYDNFFRNVCWLGRKTPGPSKSR